MEFNREALNNEVMKPFEEDLDGGSFFASNGVRLLTPLLVLLVTAFVFYGWYTDKFAISREEGRNVPLMKATTEPVRYKPKDPGGMVIANQDKMVFETIANTVIPRKEAQVRVLPMPERPVDRADLIPDSPLDKLIDQRNIDIAQHQDVASTVTDTDSKSANDVTQKARFKENTDIQNEVSQRNKPQDTPTVIPEAPIEMAKLEVPSEPVTIATQPKAPEPQQVVIETPDAEIKLAAIKPEDLRIVPTPVVKKRKILADLAAKKINNDIRIQLGSFRSISDVAPKWRELQTKYPELLGDLNFITEKADLGDKGIFYRLKAGPFSKDSHARKTCTKLRSEKAPCLFVKKN